MSFFFSSRRRHTIWPRDWSSDVCSSDLDGYLQGASTLNQRKSGETVPGLNVGGWHDAGDDDLRIESQADEVSILASAYEAFGVNYDDTTIDEVKRLVKIHQPYRT